MIDRDKVSEEVSAIVERAGKSNYVIALKKRPDLVSGIEALTRDYTTSSFKDRVYMVISGEFPECKTGRMRPFLGLEKGWGYCGKGRACQCLTEFRADGARRQRAAEKALAIAATENETPRLADLDAHRALTALIAENKRNYTTVINKNPQLYAWVMHKTAALPADSRMSERCYVALHGTAGRICPRGERRKFHSIERGYENCCANDSHCACRREAHSETMTTYHSALSEGEVRARVAAQQTTHMERHGVANPIHNPVSRQKMEATNLERYGVSFPLQSPEIRTKAQGAFEERFGVAYPGMSEELQKKAKATRFERYGSDHTMDRARAAYTEQTGFANPFNDPEIAERARLSMMERHGVEKALQSRAIFEKMRDDLILSHGVDNVMKLEDVRQKLRTTTALLWGRPHWNQAHFSDEAYGILQNKEAFSTLFNGRSLREVASYLGVAHDTARKYCYRHDVPLPRSSYETAIADFIEAQGVSVQRGNRSIIKPQELDIVVPDRKLAIEFNGLYFHRDSHINRLISGDAEVLSKDYHRNKMLSAGAQGYRLISIFEDEWVDKTEIVKSRILHALGLSKRGPGARECGIETISAAVARAFLEEHHIQGGGVYGFANYGAYHEGRLVAVMTFSRGRMGVGSRRTELLRFATDGRNLPGIANKLFKAFVRDHDPEEIVSFADRRWSQGGVYRTLGFEQVSDGAPGYFYIDCNRIKRFHRMRAQKNKIVHLIDDGANMTEKEIMLDLGYEVVYDCGSYLFQWKRPRK